jgi:hypothetical protein
MKMQACSETKEPSSELASLETVQCGGSCPLQGAQKCGSCHQRSEALLAQLVTWTHQPDAFGELGFRHVLPSHGAVDAWMPNRWNPNDWLTACIHHEGTRGT